MNQDPYDNFEEGLYMLRAKRGFAQSRDCPAQTLFVVQSMDWSRNPRIARAQSID